MRINLNLEDIQRLDKQRPLGYGAEGVVYKYDENTAIKLLYNEGDKETASSALSVINADIVDNVAKYEEIGKPLLTDLPYGVVYYENNPIGTVMKYHKDCENFSAILRNECSSFVYTIEIFQNLALELFELVELGIHNMDIEGRNILVDKEGIPHLIDLDNKYVEITRPDDDETFLDTKRQLDKMIIYFIHREKDLFGTDKLFEMIDYIKDNIDDPNQYIDYLEYIKEEYVRALNDDYDETHYPEERLSSYGFDRDDDSYDDDYGNNKWY